MENREKNVGKDLLIVNMTGCQRQKAVYLDLADGFHFFLNLQESLAFYALADHVQFVIQSQRHQLFWILFHQAFMTFKIRVRVIDFIELQAVLIKGFVIQAFQHIKVIDTLLTVSFLLHQAVASFFDRSFFYLRRTAGAKRQ